MQSIAIESKSNNKPSLSKEIYNEILEERMDEKLEMNREIVFNNLIYQKSFTSELGQITSGRPEDKSNNQKDVKN